MRRLDITAEAGDKALPACVFIHGIGMDKHLWTEPAKSRVMGGLYPLTVMLEGYGPPYRTLYHDLREAGHTVIAWSQERPVGPMGHAVKELGEAMELAEALPHSGVILIGHSRGGLIGRKYIMDSGNKTDVRGLLTLSTPHCGSTMARWAIYLSPLASFIESLLPEGQKGPLSEAIRRMTSFLGSEGVKELLPDSELIASLSPPPAGLFCLSAGGTNPVLYRIGGLSIPEALGRFVSLPEEMTEGEGDGLVSLKSSVMPGAEHLSFHVNHASVLVEQEAREAVFGRIKVLPLT